jgi:hypothetical protein
VGVKAKRAVSARHSSPAAKIASSGQNDISGPPGQGRPDAVPLPSQSANAVGTQQQRSALETHDRAALASRQWSESGGPIEPGAEPAVAAAGSNGSTSESTATQSVPVDWGQTAVADHSAAAGVGTTTYQTAARTSTTQAPAATMNSWVRLPYPVQSWVPTPTWSAPAAPSTEPRHSNGPDDDTSVNSDDKPAEKRYSTFGLPWSYGFATQMRQDTVDVLNEAADSIIKRDRRKEVPDSERAILEAGHAHTDSDD